MTTRSIHLLTGTLAALGLLCASTAGAQESPKVFGKTHLNTRASAIIQLYAFLPDRQATPMVAVNRAGEQAGVPFVPPEGLALVLTDIQIELASASAQTEKVIFYGDGFGPRFLAHVAAGDEYSNIRIESGLVFDSAVSLRNVGDLPVGVYASGYLVKDK